MPSLPLPFPIPLLVSCCRWFTPLPFLTPCYQSLQPPSLPPFLPPSPKGVLVGHTEGLTHLHSRGDGRHVLSNAKDQTAKLWDLRAVQVKGAWGCVGVWG